MEREDTSGLFPFLQIYPLLMQTKDELPSTEKSRVLDFINLNPKTAEQIHHFAWGLNAWARYLCLLEKKYSEAFSYLQLANYWSMQLHDFHFERFDSHTKSLSLTLALNEARLCFYRGDKSKGEQLLKTLREFVSNPNIVGLGDFSEIFYGKHKQHAGMLAKVLTAEISQSFLSKIDSEEVKWDLM